ncbi:MAG: YkgJ family cysteine cluster protein [Mariniblastus sp.]
MPERPIIHRYDDPVDLIWIRAAANLGLEIRRSNDAFASYDGKGTLTIAEESAFDADDCLGQMIFHEICHWLVAGRRGIHLADWGLSNIDDSDLVYEYAAHRLQAALAAPFGLREFMSVTTDWRPYWDALPEDPLRDGEDPAIAIAQSASHLARLEPFEPVLTRALSATATIADAVRDAAADPSSLWSVSRARHRLGSLLSNDEDSHCGSCAWAIARDPGEENDISILREPNDSEESPNSANSGLLLFNKKHGLGCRQHQEPGQTAPTVNFNEQACERWEPTFSIEDCGTCGACCRQGFDLLTVSANDPFKELHPDLVQLRDDGEYCVPRPEGFCVALDGDGDQSNPYRCRHYDTRPENCADFEVAGEACLLARRRVGLSR